MMTTQEFRKFSLGNFHNKVNFKSENLIYLEMLICKRGDDIFSIALIDWVMECFPEGKGSEGTQNIYKMKEMLH